MAAAWRRIATGRSGRAAILFAAAAALLPPARAGAAAFDCAKANGVEQKICASEPLSRLDDSLNAAYQSALRSSANPELVRREQRAWLQDVRNRCADQACLEAAYKQRLNALGGGSGSVQWLTFNDPHFPFSFSYPSDRRVVTGCHADQRCVALTRSSGAAGADDYLVAFEIFDGPLGRVAQDHAVFHQGKGGWTAQGRFSEHPAQPLSGSGWQGVKSVVDCGISDQNGYHAAAGECLWVALSDGKRTIVADTQGLSGNDASTMRTIESIRFH